MPKQALILKIGKHHFGYGNGSIITLTKITVLQELYKLKACYLLFIVSNKSVHMLGKDSHLTTNEDLLQQMVSVDELIMDKVPDQVGISPIIMLIDVDRVNTVLTCILGESEQPELYITTVMQWDPDNMGKKEFSFLLDSYLVNLQHKKTHVCFRQWDPGIMHWTGHEYNCCNDSFSWIANFNVLCKQFLSTTAWGQAVFCGGGNVIPSSTMDCAQVEPWAGKPICCYYSLSASSKLMLQNNRHTDIIRQRTEVRNIFQVVVLFLGKERSGELVEILMPRSSPPVATGCDKELELAKARTNGPLMVACGIFYGLMRN